MKELKTGYYNQDLKPIHATDKDMGAILFKTKDFKQLYDFIKSYDKKKLISKLDHVTGNLIIDVWNFHLDLTIYVYAERRMV